MANSTQAAAASPNFVSASNPSSEPMARFEVTVNVSSYAVGGFPRLDVPPATPDATSSFNKFIESVVGRQVEILQVDVTGTSPYIARYDSVRDTVILMDLATNVETADAVNVGDIRLAVFTR